MPPRRRPAAGTAHWHKLMLPKVVQHSMAPAHGRAPAPSLSNSLSYWHISCAVGELGLAWHWTVTVTGLCPQNGKRPICRKHASRSTQSPRPRPNSLQAACILWPALWPDLSPPPIHSLSLTLQQSAVVVLAVQLCTNTSERLTAITRWSQQEATRSLRIRF